MVRPSGLRLIHVAAYHKQAHVVSLLISLGADVNIVDDEGGYSPLVMSIIGSTTPHRNFNVNDPNKKT